MARVLVIHHDKTIRTILKARTERRHEVLSAKSVTAGVKMMRKVSPDLIVIGQDAKKQEAHRLLRFLRDNQLSLPVAVVVSRGGGVFQQRMMKLGARAFIEYPVEQETYDQSLKEAMVPLPAAAAEPEDNPTEPPPITKKELASNLSMLETRLNRKMKCVAGKNQVFLRSLLSGGQRAKPRICLKCPLRAEFGMNREVYFEFIRDVCCTKPSQCRALKRFQETRMTG